MFIPTVLQENFVKESNCESTQRKLSRSVVAFFSVCQLLFGFNFGFAGSGGRFKIISCFISMTAGFIMILLLFLAIILKDLRSLEHYLYFVQYIPFFVILHAAKYTLWDYLNDLLTKNEKKAESNDKMGIFLWSYALILFVVKISTSVVYHLKMPSFNNEWIVMNTIIRIPIIALDFIPIANFLIFYYVYTGLKDLRVKYERREISLNQLQTSYKEILDKFDKIRSSYDAIFVWGFLTESNKWMILIWDLLTLFKYSNSRWLYGCSYPWTFCITVQNCVPAVCAEMISVQHDAIKIILHGELMIETDERKIFELTRLLRYLEARPPMRKACRVLPLDLRLPLTMISVCTTYLIVIVQLTHLYD